MGYVNELSYSSNPNPKSEDESTKTKDRLKEMIKHPAKNITGYNTVTLRYQNKSPTHDQLVDNLDTILKKNELSPYGLYPTTKSMQGKGVIKGSLEPIRTSLKTYKGKEQQRILII